MMNFKEAAKRIEDHMEVHHLVEDSKAEKITEALSIATDLLLFMNDHPNLVSQYVMSKRWAVVGFDYLTAGRIMTSIETQSGKRVLRRRRSKYDVFTEFTDGTTIKWLNASESSRAYRVGKMWCDKNINTEILRSVIFPLYRGKRDDIIWL